MEKIDMEYGIWKQKLEEYQKNYREAKKSQSSS